jgi:hypothetical protein
MSTCIATHTHTHARLSLTCMRQATHSICARPCSLLALLHSFICRHPSHTRRDFGVDVVTLATTSSSPPGAGPRKMNLSLDGALAP